MTKVLAGTAMQILRDAFIVGDAVVARIMGTLVIKTIACAFTEAVARSIVRISAGSAG